MKKDDFGAMPTENFTNQYSLEWQKEFVNKLAFIQIESQTAWGFKPKQMLFISAFCDLVKELTIGLGLTDFYFTFFHKVEDDKYRASFAYINFCKKLAEEHQDDIFFTKDEIDDIRLFLIKYGFSDLSDDKRMCLLLKEMIKFCE